ncbi:MAG: hypothetical protein WBB37_08160 [bacterium]
MGYFDGIVDENYQMVKMQRVIVVVLLLTAQCMTSCALRVSRGIMNITLGQDSSRVTYTLDNVEAFFAVDVDLGGRDFTLIEGSNTVLILNSSYPQLGNYSFPKDISEFEDFELIVFLDSTIRMENTIDLTSDAVKVLFIRQEERPRIAEASSQLEGYLVLSSKSDEELAGTVIFKGPTTEIPTLMLKQITGLIYGYVDCHVDFKAIKQEKSKISSYLNLVLHSKSRLREFLE